MNRSTLLAPLALLTAMVALAACGDDDAVEHETASQALTERARTFGTRAESTMRAMEGTDLGSQLVVDQSTCALILSPEGAETEECFVDDVEEESAADAIAATTDSIVAELERTILTKANIESQSDSEIVYLMRGSSFCAGAAAPDRAACVADVDARPMRVKVSYDGGGDVYTVEVLGGASRHSLGIVEVAPNSIEGRMNLASLKAGLTELDPELGAEFPAQFEGVVATRLSLDSASVMTSSLSILDPVRILDADAKTDVSLGRAAPAAAFTVDDAAKTVAGSLSFGALALGFSDSSFGFGGDTIVFDAAEGEEIDPPDRMMRVEAAKLVGSMTANLASERLEVRGLELGTAASPASLSIDGRRVMSALIAAASGGAIDFDLSSRGQGAGEGVVLTSPTGASIGLEYSYGDLVGADGVDAEEWMRADTVSIALGAASSLWFGERGVRVEAGTLSVASSAASVSLDAAAGQCLIDDFDDEPKVCDAMSCSGDDSGAPAAHPATGMRVEACSSPN